MPLYNYIDVLLKNSKVVIPLLISLLSITGISGWFGYDQSTQLDKAKELQKDMVGHIEYVNEHYVMPKHIKEKVATTGSCDFDCIAKIRKEVNTNIKNEVKNHVRNHVRQFHE